MSRYFWGIVGLDYFFLYQIKTTFLLHFNNNLLCNFSAKCLGFFLYLSTTNYIVFIYLIYIIFKLLVLKV